MAQLWQLTTRIAWGHALGVLIGLSSVVAQTYTAEDVDFDGSGTIGFGDFISFASTFGQADAVHDVNGNGRVDFEDFLLLVDFYGSVIVSPAIEGDRLLVTDPAGGAHPMVLVPGGDFLMGLDEGLSNQRPMRTVTVDSFWIGVYEITNRQFAAFLDSVGTESPEGTPFANLEGRVFRISQTEEGFSPLTPNDDVTPVVHVTWVGADAFCAWMGGRLPTEAEWEKAARGTDGRLYPWGDEPPSASLLNYNKNVGEPTPVGSYPKGVSPYGALDMAGNAFEWVADYYDADYYAVAPTINPPGPESGTHHPIRGGAHPAIVDAWVQTTYRQPTSESQGLVDTGFRCARNP